MSIRGRHFWGCWLRAQKMTMGTNPFSSILGRAVTESQASQSLLE